MNVEALITQLPPLPFRELFTLLAALSAALLVASLASRLTVNLGPAPARALSEYVGANREADLVERLGQWLLHRLPSCAPWATSNSTGAGWSWWDNRRPMLPRWGLLRCLAPVVY